jgi:hypothetical protein
LDSMRIDDDNLFCQLNVFETMFFWRG